jgi:DNA-directed RNA polymerase subunit RPC12/RpoP
MSISGAMPPVLITGIKSKPIYSVLQPDLSGKFHLLVGHGSGRGALLRLLANMPDGAEIQVLYAAESRSGKVGWGEQLESHHSNMHRWDSLRSSHPTTIVELLADLDQVLSSCCMGTRLYVAGSESFIGSVGQIAAKYDLAGDEVQREQCGSAARRVYCIHCKASQENVKTNVIRCPGCGRHLLVRDHYSRRLAAYMGVMADAEAPGVLPPIEERFV